MIPIKYILNKFDVVKNLQNSLDDPKHIDTKVEKKRASIEQVTEYLKQMQTEMSELQHSDSVRKEKLDTLIRQVSNMNIEN